MLDALRARVVEQLQALTAAQHAAQSGATHEETRSEHPKDTRAIEAQYLARGLAARVEGLRDTMAALGVLHPVPFGDDEPIGLSAVVGVEDEDGDSATYFIVPAAGGETVQVDGGSFQSLTPASPLGQALIGRRVDDDVEIELRAGKRQLTITSVR